MLKPKKESEKEYGGFVCCDIENWPDGSVLTINTAWRQEGTIVHERHTTWQQWFEWLVPLAENDERFRCVYAHNGGGWDWLSFVHWLLTGNKRDDVTISICCVGSKIVVAMVTIKDRIQIKLADSLQLLRSGLDDLGKRFVGRGKIDLGGRLPHEVYQQDHELFDRYENDDTELLLEVLEKALHILRENVAKIERFSATIGGTAMNVFRTLGFDGPIMIPSKPELKDFLRLGYTGGRVECFKPGVYDCINVYDINSLYPYAMLTTEVPTTDRGFWVGKDYDLLPDDLGIFEIEWEQCDQNIPPILCIGGAGTYSGRGIFFSPELKLIKELDPKGSITIHKGYCFLDRGRIFKPFVERLYSLRRSDPGGPLSELCKFLLNSLYGKFGQHAEREKAISCPFETLYEMACDGKAIRPLNRAAGLWLDTFGKADRPDIDGLPVPMYGLTADTHCEYEHVGIAGVITSAARVALYRGLLSAGFADVVYCDTDSVHCTSELPVALVGSDIGLFKRETLPGTAGAYSGKKLYALRFANGSEKVRAKGVSVRRGNGSRNGCELGFADMVRICRGEAKAVEYKQPTTVMELFAGVDPCVFQIRKRTLRRTAKESNEQRREKGDVGKGGGNRRTIRERKRADGLSG